MVDVTEADARRTKKSIIIYVALTAALSSIFWVIRSNRAQSSNLLVVGEMWCPGV